VADIGSHWLDLVRFVTGKRVASVLADFATVHPVRRVPVGPVETFAGDDGGVERVAREVRSEDLANVLLRFDDGTRGSLVVSQVSAGRKNRVWFEADGTEGALQWDAEANEQLWLGHRDGPNEVHWREPGPVSDYPSGHPEGFPDTFKQLYRAVYRAVEAGGMPAEPDFPTFHDGHRAVVVCEAIAESARGGRWIEVPARVAQPLPAPRS
jgi:predicted dehydrogenase